MILKVPKKPALSEADVAKIVARGGIDRKKYPVVVVGLRGYFRDTMGAPGVNDRGIYDDALFIHSAQAFAAFNGNTDPSAYRKRSAAMKGMATLKPGVWFAHRFDQ